MFSKLKSILGIGSSSNINTPKPLYEENNLLLISSSPRVLQDSLSKLSSSYEMSSNIIRLDNLDYAVVLKYKEVK